MKWNKLILYSVALLTCFSSCDYLDLEPEDGVTREKFWKTKEEVENAVMGCYAAMMGDKVMQRFFFWGEIRADLVTSSPRQSIVGLKDAQNGDITSTNYISEWASVYAVINNCNTVLEFAKQTQQIDQSFSEALLKEYEAEVICIRALMYFYLVRTFGDVPYITTPSLTDKQEYVVPKNSGEEILNALILDLKSVDRTQNGSFTGIPYHYGTTNTTENKGRFTVWSLKSLLADIYLWKEDYENCIKECNQIIDGGQYKLVPVQRTEAEVEDAMGNLKTVYYPSEGDIDNLFLNTYVKGNSVESIFELQFGTDYENPFYGLFNATSGALVANTEVLSNELFLKSALDRGWFDIRDEGIASRQGLVWKWIGLSRNSYTYRASGESFSNWIFYRLADIYLMKAEALNQQAIKTSNSQLLVESLSVLRIIRERANATESTDLIPEGMAIDLSVASTLEEFILQERAREFTHEGKRWFDVLRNAKRNNYKGIHHLIRLAAYAASPDKASGLQNKWQGNYNSHYLPINEGELRANKALVQNPFYL